jgi:proline iminopeptidase
LYKLDYQEPLAEPEYGDNFDNSIEVGSRLETHYFANGSFLTDNYILENTDKLRSISCVIVHGRFDMMCPPIAAYDLAQAWGDNCYLQYVLAGHDKADPVLREAISAHQRSFLV